MCNLAPGRASAETRMQGPLDADAFLQLAADDGLYSNVAALLTGPQDQLMRAAPDASFGWSPCTYTLATSEGSWPTSISTVVPCVDMYAVAQQCRTAMRTGLLRTVPGAGQPARRGGTDRGLPRYACQPRACRAYRIPWHHRRR